MRRSVYGINFLSYSLHRSSCISLRRWCISIFATSRTLHVYHEVTGSVFVISSELTHCSTLTGQLVITFGGSRFPGAMSTMLIEVLPFLRGAANDIRAVLGDDHPGLIPTVMAVYALTSFLTGAAFVVLGVLKLGNLVLAPPILRLRVRSLLSRSRISRRLCSPALSAPSGSLCLLSDWRYPSHPRPFHSRFRMCRSHSLPKVI